MRNLMLVLSFMCLLALGLNAQDKQTETIETIVFDKTVHDYGTIERAGDGNTEFKFTNKGKDPLILTNVRSSCGCTVPQWPREPILPGESGVIKVKYDTNRMGAINKSVTVTSNATNPNVVLRIKGNVIAKQ